MKDDKIKVPKWLQKIADENDMSVSVSMSGDKVCVTFSGCTSQGQDVEEEFDLDNLDKEKLIEEIKWFTENWDSEEKADIWCIEEEEEDEDGDLVMVKHGANGAPDLYEDVVADMDEYRDMFVEIQNDLQKLIDKEKKC